MSSVAEQAEAQAGQFPCREDALPPRLLALYRTATPEQKLTVVMRLNHTLQGLKEAQLLATRPDWTQAQRQTELRRWWLSARD